MANAAIIDDIVFSPAGAERMRILENGDLFFERGIHDLTLAIPTPAAARTITFPDAAGTVAVSATAPITLSTAGAIGVTSANLLGTTNRVTVTDGTGVLLGTTNATLTLPQDIHTGATPTFAGLVATTPAPGNALILSGAGANIAFTAGLAQITTAAAQHLALMPGGNVGIGTTTPQERLTLAAGANFATEMAVPTSVTVTCSITGGSLGGGVTYFYRVVASDGVGLTIGSAEVSCVMAATSTGSVTISWTAPTGAVSFRIYGRVSPQNQFWTNAASPFTDTGTVGTAGTVPTATTAYVSRLAAAGNSWLLGGNVGIGTTAPTRRLAIVDPGVGFDRPALNNLAMFTGDVERVRIDAAGNVGIGTTAPAPLAGSKGLHVLDSRPELRLESPAPGGVATIVLNNSGARWDINIDGGINNALGFWSPTSYRFVVTTAGNVGIGTTGPTSRLGVLGNLAVGGTFGSLAAPAGGAIIEGNVGIGTTGPTSRLGVLGNLAVGGTFGSLAAPAGGAIIEGNVGIGTTAPGERLTLGGADQIGFRTQTDHAIRIGYWDAGGGDHGFHVDRRHAGIWHNRQLVVRADTGNVGIGTTAPTAGLHLYNRDILIGRTDVAGQNIDWAGGGVNPIARIRAGSTVDPVGWAAGGGVGMTFNTTAFGVGLVERVRITGAGNVGIGTTSPGTRRLNIAATATGAHPIATAWDLHSDIAFKTNIRDLNHGLSEILQLKPRIFDLKIDGSPHIGFIAQELGQVIPELVSGQEGEKGISYANLTAVLAKAIQEQQVQIEELKLKLDNNGSLNGTDVNIRMDANDTNILANISGIIRDRLANLGLYIEQGIAQVRELIAERVVAKQICLEGDNGETICVNKNQLEELLQKNGINEQFEPQPPAEVATEVEATPEPNLELTPAEPASAPAPAPAPVDEEPVIEEPVVEEPAPDPDSDPKPEATE